MQKTTLIACLLGAGAVLAGCAEPAPKRTTFDAIKAELKAESAPRAGRPAVRQPDAVADALLPPVSAMSTRLPKARAALEERFNVAFNNVPAAQFYNALVEGTRYNMLVHPEVSGTITANLKDVTMVEALDAIREMYGYDYKMEGTRISIKPLTMQTRVFQVNYLVGSRKGSSSLKVTSTSVSSGGSGGQNQNQNQNQNNGNNNQNGNSSGGGPSESSSVTMTSSSEFWTELKSALDAIVGSAEGGRAVVISPQSGVIVVRGMPDDLRNVDAYLKASQLSVNRQVILEAKILEVELNDSFQMGINWAGFTTYRNGNPKRVSSGFLQPGVALRPLPTDGSAQGPISSVGGAGISAIAGSVLAAADAASGSLFGLAFQTNNFATLISFLESQGTVHVLSSPRIATMNNQKAVLKIGTDEFYVTGVTSTQNTNLTGTSTSTPSVTLAPFFSGVVLDVTPQIDEKGNILLHVHPSVSQVATINKGINLGSAGSLTLPLAASSTSEMDSMVRGQDGHVVAIGGLMRQSSTADQSGLPGASSVPVLGALFSNKARVNQKRELVVLIKPTIVDGNNAFAQDMLDTGNRVQQLDPRNAGERR
ncbi:pilus (MSHA type) biogenesis protein MshL [Massilia sp. TSP1-1-2]|uniref:pilus (MSHA type) biogenesis protein MshL n=1 Tax=Massilia sp. TSP1-1-2 TaxID=2804649 RepID=UPI003CF44578